MAILVAPALFQATGRLWGPVGDGSNHHRYGEVKTRLTIGAGIEIGLLAGRKKGPQLALEPLNGLSIAGYVLKP
jgi:hypothetical protein